nr:MAG TPA: hypothetical protein [Caudoviricetes sp.]DAZ42143.1 MAG TPA: hypothetical protein [Caudoviricetes sp.]
MEYIVIYIPKLLSYSTIFRRKRMNIQSDLTK